MKKITSEIVIVLLLMVTPTSSLNIHPVRATPTTIIVPDNYPTIQAAINAASDGDTIFVRSGTYYENLAVDKTVSLAGENPQTTIVEGSIQIGDLSTLVNADFANVTRFTIQGGIQADIVNNCSITECNIVANGTGISFQSPGPAYPCNNCILSGNNITSKVVGISLDPYGSNFNVSRNNIVAHWIGISLGPESSNVSENNISGGLIGIYLHASNSTLNGNNITNNSDGIFLDSSNNAISGNNIMNNSNGIEFYSSSSNVIYHNNFINNYTQVNGTASTNIWDNGYPSGGNYWSDYDGVDAKSGPNQDQSGSDGLGDTPYVIDANNVDHYPLTTPYGSNLPLAFPNASFVYTPSDAIVGQTVTFNASDSTCLNGSITRYNWDFGDGASDTGIIVSHTYNTYGNYTVTLTVVSNTFIPNTQEQSIYQRESPTAVFSFSPNLKAGNPITFDASASNPRGGNITSYVWDFGDGNITSTVDPIANHIFTSANTFNVTLTVLDSEGLNASLSETLLVTMPTVNFSSSSAPNVGYAMTFNATISDPQGGNVVDYLWNFGDSNTTSTTSSTISHTYTYQNTFNVSLTVLDSVGLNSSFSSTILVMMPTAVSIHTSSSSTVVGFNVNINGSLSDFYGQPLQNEPVVLSYTFQGATSWFPISSGITDTSGNYFIQWVPAATGYFTIKAEWAGNATHLSATNNVTLSSAPYMNQYVFSVESNSTISSLAFNTTSSELSFTASGPSGTTGYVKVTVAKSIVADATSIKVYLDNNQTSYSIESVGDSWLFTFNYTHSTHKVRVDLHTIVGPEFPSAMIWSLFLMTSLLAITAAKMFKRKAKPNSKDPFSLSRSLASLSN